MTQAANLAALGSSGVSLGMKNRIINGAMVIAQRGTTSTTQGYTTVDRFYINRSGGVTGLTMSQVYGAFGTTAYALKLQRSVSDTSTAPIVVYQAIEGANCRDLAGQSVTVSFNIGTGGNASALSGSSVALYYQTTTTDIGPTGSWTQISSSGISLTAGSSSFTQKTATFAVPSTATQLLFVISLTVSGTAGVDDSYYLTNVQLEAGSTATNFDFRSYGTELALCQRYFYASPAVADAFLGSGFGAGSGVVYAGGYFPVTMRASPTISYQGSFTSTVVTTTGIGGTITGLSSPISNPNSWYLQISGSGTYPNYAYVQIRGSTAFQLTGSAEL